MDIRVGDEYLLNIPKNMHDQKIDYLGKVTSPRYINWGEISGKRVKIKGSTKILVDYFEASLLQDSSSSFYITKKMLSIIPRLDTTCKCSVKKLFSAGCGCGAFNWEMKNR